MNNLTLRIIVAVPAAALFIISAWLGSWYFHSLLLIITFLIQAEIIKMGTKMGLVVNKVIVYATTGWILCIDLLPFPVIIGGVLFLLLCIREIFEKDKKSLTRLIVTPFFGLFVPLGMMALLKIRAFHNNETGVALTLAVLLLIWGNDVFAYFGGKYLGKHKLAPDLSPNKTIEGFLSGFLGGVVGIYLVALLLPFTFPLTPLYAAPMVLISGILGPSGDLLESKMKRIADIKDSSQLIPGHGGFFDRFDALILTAPGIYIYIYLLSYYNIQF